MVVKLRVLILSLSVFCFFRACPLIVGADSLVSVEPIANFPAIDIDNQILQFAFMQNGFTLADATTTCTFGAVFPVAGDVSLSGGTLFLSTDLIFQNPATLASAGYFWGNNHQIDLSQTITWLSGANESSFRDVSVFLNNDFIVAGTVKFLGSCLLDGRSNNVILGDSANIIIGHNTTLTLRNVELSGIELSKIRCLDNSGNLILDNVQWVQSDDYTFTQGSLLFVNKVECTGQHVFNFSPTRTSTISSGSTLYFDLETTFSYAPSVPNKGLLWMNDATSILYLNGCSLFATRTGLELSQGTMVIDNHVTLSSQALFSAEGIELKNTLNTILLSNAVLELFGIVLA